MVFGMAFSNCSRGEKLMATDLQGNKAKTFATVGDVELPTSMVEQAIAKQEQQSQLPPDIIATLPPEYRIQTVSSGVTQSIQAAEVYEIAKRLGYKTDDDSIKKTLHMATEAEFLAYVLDSAKKSGQIKADATIKDLEEMAKPQLQGQTLADFYKKQLTELESQLKDKQKQVGLKLGAGQQFVVDKWSAGFNPSDDEVKKGFETYEIKRVLVKSPTAATDAAAKSKADKAYADLKAGKSFEDVMEAYTEDVQQDPKKKKSENAINLSLAQLENLADFKTVLKLQPGSFSEPEKIAEGYSILKYVGKKVDIPKDYETKKATYRQQNISQQVQKKFKEELDKVEKDVKPKFEVKSYEAAYRYQKAMAIPVGPAQDQEFRAIYDLTKGISSSDEKPEVGAMLRVITIQHLYDQPTADKVKLKDERIDSLENYLTFSDNWAYRKEVIDSYKAKGDKTKAFAQVMTGLERNTKYDAQAQTTFAEISAKFTEIKAAGLVSADQEKQFRLTQDQWAKDKMKYDEEQALLKKKSDEEKKAAAEAQKKSKSGPSTLAPPTTKAPGK